MQKEASKGQGKRGGEPAGNWKKKEKKEKRDGKDGQGDPPPESDEKDAKGE